VADGRMTEADLANTLVNSCNRANHSPSSVTSVGGPYHWPRMGMSKHFCEISSLGSPNVGSTRFDHFSPPSSSQMRVSLLAGNIRKICGIPSRVPFAGLVPPVHVCNRTILAFIRGGEQRNSSLVFVGRVRRKVSGAQYKVEWKPRFSVLPA